MTTRYSDTILIGQKRVAFQSFCHSILCCCFCFVFVTAQGDVAYTSEALLVFHPIRQHVMCMGSMVVLHAHHVPQVIE